MSGGERPATAVMIDRPGSADRDDALWVARDGDGWRAWVHVADVARVVPLGGAVDMAACRRGRTSYLSDRSVPMLPAAEEAAAALRPGEPVPTCLIELTAGPDGELREVVIDRATLAQPSVASYQEAAGALADPGHRLHGMLTEAYALAQTLLARRRAAGALAIYDLLRGWATDEDGRIVRLASPERNAGYLIVQELMIAANEAAARWALEQDLPILFRNHAPGTAAREELASQLAVAAGPDGQARLPTVARQLAMTLRPAVYEPRAAGHFGLNLPAYAHVTSPLRRYPDLVNQRILLAAAQRRASPYQLDTLAETAAAINLRLEADRARKAAGMRETAQAATRLQLVEADFQQLDDGTFGKLVKLAVVEDRFSPVLAAEIERRVDAGRLLPREAASVLFGAQGDRWLPVRQRLLRWLADEPMHALTALSVYGQRDYGGEVRWEEQPVGTTRQPMFTASARLGDRRSPTRAAPSKRAARQQAALALVAGLAKLPDPSSDIAPSAGLAAEPARRAIPDGHPPAMAVNELAQMGRLRQLEWSFAAAGTPHQPTHICTVTARLPATGEPLAATGSGTTKAEAKTAAAAALFAQLPRD